MKNNNHIDDFFKQFDNDIKNTEKPVKTEIWTPWEHIEPSAPHEEKENESIKELLTPKTDKTRKDAPAPELEKLDTIEKGFYNAREDAKRVRAICAEYARNGDKARTTKTEILKGMKKGEPIEVLFLKACECISAMTGEQLFYDQIKKDLLTIYGNGFGEPAALDLQAQEIKARLEKLEQAKQREQTPEEMHRINAAIIEHEKALKNTMN